MTLPEASQLLELPTSATPDEIEARFLELRRKLEDKIAKAPTPGLQAKYRASLAEITTAFETLTLAADGSELPVLQRAERATPPSQPSAASPAAHDTAPPKPSKAKPAGNREFLVVVVLAVALLAGGGWWVIKFRAEAAEKARVEALAKAEADRVAAEAKATAERKAAEEKAEVEKEKVRQENLFAQLRATQAEVKIGWDGIEKMLTTNERKLSELKADARNVKDLARPEAAELQARLAAQGDYVEWLQGYVGRNSVRTLLAKLDALLSAKAIDAAAALAAELQPALATAEKTCAEQAASLLALGKDLHIESSPTGLSFSVTDSYGRVTKGTTPGMLKAPWGRIEYAVEPPGPGWSAIKDSIPVLREGGKESSGISVKFKQAKARVSSVPAGLPFVLTNNDGLAVRGTTPADLENLPAGWWILAQFSRPNWPEDFQKAFMIKADETNEITAEFPANGLVLSTEPSGVSVSAGERKLGVTPLAISNLPVGPMELKLEKLGYESTKVQAVVTANDITKLSASLRAYPLVTFKGEPANAEIFSGSDRLGKADETYVVDPADPVIFQVRAEGYYPFEIWVTPNWGDKVKNLPYKLKPVTVADSERAKIGLSLVVLDDNLKQAFVKEGSWGNIGLAPIGSILVRSIQAASPAAEAKLELFDRILTMAESDHRHAQFSAPIELTGKSVAEVAALFRNGPEGSRIQLTFQRRTGTVRTVTLVRTIFN